jgi:hypothetical protein
MGVAQAACLQIPIIGVESGWPGMDQQTPRLP